MHHTQPGTLTATSKHGNVAFDGDTVTITTSLGETRTAPIGAVSDIDVAGPVLWLLGSFRLRIDGVYAYVRFGRRDAEAFSIMAVALTHASFG